jgi:hypothetical protein
MANEGKREPLKYIFLPMPCHRNISAWLPIIAGE